MPNSSPSSVESTSSGVIANMVENPGLTDDEVMPFLSFLEIDNAQMVKWIEPDEIEAAFTKAKLPIGKKASFRKVYNSLRAHFIQPDPVPNTSTQPTPTQTSPSNPTNLLTSAATSLSVSPSSSSPTLSNNHTSDLTNVSYWCDPLTNFDHELKFTSTKAISSVAHLKCPDDTPYNGHSDPRSINYVLSLIRYEAKQNGLGPRMTFQLLSRCLSQLVNVKLQAYLEYNVPPTQYLVDYNIMLSTSLAYLQSIYASSNSHTEMVRYAQEAQQASTTTTTRDVALDLPTQELMRLMVSECRKYTDLNKTKRQPSTQGLPLSEKLLGSSPMDSIHFQRPPAKKWDKRIKLKHHCRDIVAAAINRLLLDDGSWTTTDKVKLFTADIGQFGNAYDDQLLVF